MITDQDITKLKKTFATKVEFNKLEKKVDGLVYEVGDLKVEVAEINERIESLGDKIESFVVRMETKMDSFLGNMDRLDIEDKAATSILDRHASQIGALAAVHTQFILPA
jgi:predicted  nucleic acid-binding Zn-ribbon protein